MHQQQSQLQQQHRDDAGGEAGDDAGEDAGVDAGDVFFGVVFWVRTGPTLLFAYSYFDGLSMSSSGRPLPVAMNSKLDDIRPICTTNNLS